MPRSSKQSSRNAIPAGESSHNAYTVREEDDDDDILAPLPDESGLQVGTPNIIASSSHMAETTVPNFLLKLWRLVEDKNYDFCISWDESGSSFHVKEPYAFSKDVLPLFFKHSNLNSFIRQLNMYGFRKVTNLEQGALKHQSNDTDSLEFHHQYFVRGHPELLQFIRRKNSSSKSDLIPVHNDSGGARRLNQALEEIRQLREKQMGMDAKLNQVKRENETLWREMAHMRQMHAKQQQVVDKLMRFLLTAVQPTAGGRLGKRNLLAIGTGALGQQPDGDASQSRKRSRMGADDPEEMIECLEQQLKNQSRMVRPRMDSMSLRAGDGDSGPMIADITEEELEPEIDTGALATNSSDVTSTIDYSGPVASTQSGVGVLGMAPNSTDQQLPVLELREPDPLVGFLPAMSKSPLIQQQPLVNEQQEQMVQQPWSISDVLNVPFSGNGAVTQTNYSGLGYLSPPGKVEGDSGLRPKSGGEFSQEYLDYVQADLDSLKEFLSAEGLELDKTSLDDLFVASTSPPTTDPILAVTQTGGIVGNELQVYKAPELLFGFNSGAPDAASSEPTVAIPTSVQASAPVSESGDLETIDSSISPIFSNPPISDASIFDPLTFDLITADPLIDTSQGSLSTPIMSPSLGGIHPILQPQVDAENVTAGRLGGTGGDLQFGNQAGNGVRLAADNLQRSTFSKSRSGKRR